MAAGLNVCSASHCAGAFKIGSVKVDSGRGIITGFPVAGRVKGPMSQGSASCACKPTAQANIAASINFL
jgi:hypothetical protein